MKTPREILLELHQGAQPKLDRIRRRVLSEALARQAHAPTARRPVDLVLTLWRHLIWPCRRTWSGLAVLWLALLFFNLGLRKSSPAANHAQRSSTVAAVRTLSEQRRLLAELLRPLGSPPAERAHPLSRSRSERTADGRAC